MRPLMKLPTSNTASFAKPAWLGGCLEIAHAWAPPALRPVLDRIGLSPTANRFLDGALWGIAGALIGRALVLLSSVVAGRMLGRESFGELGIIQNTANTFSVFAGFGLGLAATKHVAEFRKADPARAGRAMAAAGFVAAVFGAAVSLALVAAAPFMAENLLRAPHLSGLLRVGACLVFLGAVNGAQMGALAGFESFRQIARINLTTGLLSFPLAVGGVWFWGLQGAVWSLVLSLGANWFLTRRTLIAESRRAGVPIQFAVDYRELRGLFSFSSIAFAGGVAVWSATWTGNWLLIRQPDGYGEMGLYNVASQWRMAVLFVPASLGAVALPMMSSLRGEGRDGSFQRVFRVSVLLNGLVAVVAAVPLLFVAGPLLAGYGPGFLEGRIAFVIALVSAVVIAVNNALSRAMAGAGRMWADLSFNFVWSIAFLAGGWWLVPRWGAAGLAGATLAAAVVQGFFQWVYLLIRSPKSLSA